MSYTYITANAIVPAVEQALFPELKPGCYLLRDIKLGMSVKTALVETETFKAPSLSLGTSGRIDKVFKTFKYREKSTGVLLSGLKGTGKTFLAKEICRAAVLKHSLPVIIVDEYNENLSDFLQQIEQEVVVFFDEFEKTFPKRSDHNYQDELLTLLDGIFEKKRLFLMTTNDTRSISEFVINRPGRCYYNFEFEELEKSLIEAYCKKKLTDNTHFAEIESAAELIDGFSFDILSALVEQYNLFGAVDYNDMNVQEKSARYRDLYHITVLDKKTKKTYKVTDYVDLTLPDICIDFIDNDYCGIKGFIKYNKDNASRTERAAKYDGFESVTFKREDLVETDGVTYKFDTKQCEIVLKKSFENWELNLHSRIKKLAKAKGLKHASNKKNSE